MDVVAANHISRTGTANIDPIAVAQDLHRVVNLVEFNEIVTRVQIATDIVQRRICGELSDLMPSDRANRLTLIRLREEAGHDSGNDQRRIVRMMDQIVRHTVLPALADVDPG